MGDPLADAAERADSVEAAGTDYEEVSSLGCAHERVDRFAVLDENVVRQQFDRRAIEALALARGNGPDPDSESIRQRPGDCPGGSRLERSVEASHDRARNRLAGRALARNENRARRIVQSDRGDTAQGDPDGT